MRVILLFLLSFSAAAKSYLVYRAPTDLADILKKDFSAREVFSDKEKSFLDGSNVETNILELEVSPQNLEELKRTQKTYPSALLESNPAQTYMSFQEPYADLQWGLKNHGQELIEWQSDIDTVTIVGKAGEDIAAFEVEENPGNKVKVAVIDSGVDLHHPDLIEQVLTKPKECLALERYKKCLQTNPDRESCHKRFASFDSDGNGYPMDCKGWNSGAEDIPGSGVSGGPDIYDREGHGTHVAGIIAAKKNAIGIQGVIQNVELIPVQVGTSSSSGSKSEAPTDKIAKAILYAVKSGAQVINLSLGWRLDEDSLLMRQIIELALSKNILVVAAAGNDAHNAPVYPCSYEGVICVASHTITGELSSFSNYGAHVDLAAPGSKILGTWPTNKRSRAFTQDDTYEYLSGTSQAAPHVTGLLARLLNLGFSPEEAKIALLKGARRPHRNGPQAVRHGNASLAGALKAKGSSFLYPINKSPALVKWTTREERRSFLFKFENLGAEAKNVSIHFERVHKEDKFEPLQENFYFKSITPGAKLEERIYFKSEDDSEGEFIFKATIKSEDENKSYLIEAKAVSLVGNGEDQVGQESFDIKHFKGLTGATVERVKNHTAAPGSDFIAIKTENGKTFVSLIAQKGLYYEQTSWTSLPAKSFILLNLSKVDLNLDDDPEYVITTVSSSPQNRETTFFIFNKNLKPIKEMIAPANTYDNELAALPGSFQWARYQDRMVPAWIGAGKRPQNERPAQGPWEAATPERTLNRLYLLTPQGARTVSFPGEETMPLSLLYQSEEAKVEGRISIIAGDSFGYYKRFSTYSFEGSLKKLNEFELFPYVDLLNARPLPLTGAAGENAFFAVRSLKGQRIVSFDLVDSSLQIDRKRVEPISKDSPIERVLSYDGARAIFQTRHSLCSELNCVPSKVGLRRIFHQTAATKSALYLKSENSPGLSAELIMVKDSGRLSRPAKWMKLGVNGCAEIGLTQEERQESLTFVCSETRKIIKYALRP